jgi:PhnB protein
MLGVKPYISFKGNCEEAISFYTDKLGAELLFMQRYGESPMAGKGPDEMIMHCSIKIGDSVIMACDNVFEDTNPTTIGNNITLAVDQMSESATIIMPLQETFWAERFGMLTDKFGINWMFNCDKPMSDHAQATK